MSKACLQCSLFLCRQLLLLGLAAKSPSSQQIIQPVERAPLSPCPLFLPLALLLSLNGRGEGSLNRESALFMSFCWLVEFMAIRNLLKRIIGCVTSVRVCVRLRVCGCTPMCLCFCVCVCVCCVCFCAAAYELLSN